MTEEMRQQLDSILTERLKSPEDTGRLAAYAACYLKDILREHPLLRKLQNVENVISILQACHKHLEKKAT